MTTLPDRATVVQALLEHLTAELAAVESILRLASDEATSEETRSEGKYDTRATEASYLARGQAERVGALRAGVDEARQLRREPTPEGTPVGIGCLVRIAMDTGEERVVLLARNGGGTRIFVDGTAIRVVTPSSPFGRALLGAEVDEDVEVDLGARELEVTVLEIG